MKSAPTREGRGAGGGAGSGQEQRNYTTGGRPVENLLPRLDGVAEYRGGWRAFSPFQEKRQTRTLSIREADDGTVLIHDFAGRDTREILEAIGLQVADLFPPRPNDRSSIRHQRNRPRISARDALDLLSVESLVVLNFGRQVADMEDVTREDYLRCREAVARIEELRRAAL